MVRIRQECGQKWYRRTSWRRPVLRKLSMKLVKKVDNLRFDVETTGLHMRGIITDMEERTYGFAVGPILVTWR